MVLVFNDIKFHDIGSLTIECCLGKPTKILKLDEIRGFMVEGIMPCTDSQEARLRKLFGVFLPNCWLISVKKIENRFLENTFKLKKLEYISRYKRVDEMELYHATSKRILDFVVRDNLDWRKTERHRFGHGVSFSPNMDYANFYCNRKNGIARAMIVFSVLIADPTEGHNSLKIPPGHSDTSVSKHGLTYIKYNDNEFLPLYAIYYLCSKSALDTVPSILVHGKSVL